MDYSGINYLAVITQDGEKIRIPIEDSLEIGRREEDPTYMLVARTHDREIPLGIEDAFVSRHHARICWKDGRLTVKDLGSKTGTFLNDEALPGWSSGGESETTEIKRDCHIQIGRLARSTAVGKFANYTIKVERPLLTEDVLQEIRTEIEQMASVRAGATPPWLINFFRTVYDIRERCINGAIVREVVSWLNTLGYYCGDEEEASIKIDEFVGRMNNELRQDQQLDEEYIKRLEILLRELKEWARARFSTTGAIHASGAKLVKQPEKVEPISPDMSLRLVKMERQVEQGFQTLATDLEQVKKALAEDKDERKKATEEVGKADIGRHIDQLSEEEKDGLIYGELLSSHGSVIHSLRFAILSLYTTLESVLTTTMKAVLDKLNVNTNISVGSEKTVPIENLDLGEVSYVLRHPQHVDHRRIREAIRHGYPELETFLFQELPATLYPITKARNKAAHQGHKVTKDVLEKVREPILGVGQTSLVGRILDLKSQLGAARQNCVGPEL